MAPVASNKDHQYIYEILSASGLLHKEWGKMTVDMMPRCDLWLETGERERKRSGLKISNVLFS
jgi:hypothetical protein